MNLGIGIDITKLRSGGLFQFGDPKPPPIPINLLPGAAITVGGTFGVIAEYFSQGHTLRLRQRGPIRQVQFHTNIVSGLTSVKVRFWRWVSGTLFNMVGETENLLSQCAAATTNLCTLSTPLSGPQEGDYYSILLEGVTAGNYLPGTALGTKALSRGFIGIAGSSNFDWFGGTTILLGAYVQVRAYAYKPKILLIGNSHISGAITHRSFREDRDVAGEIAETNISDSMPFKYANLSGNLDYQNMGIGGEASDAVSARFATDAIAFSPQGIVIGCPGRNDVVAGLTSTQSRNNLDAMMDACHAAGIPLAIMEPAPWEAGTNTENQTLDALTALCKADILAHPGRNKFFEIRPRIGEFRVGGDAGNLWNFQATYDSGDNLHPSPAGYQQMSEALHGATT